MKKYVLEDLQESVRDKTAFKKIDEYAKLAIAFLNLIPRLQPTRIVSPSIKSYIFFQYGAKYSHRISRPLNTNLFIEDPDQLGKSFERFLSFLDDVRKMQSKVLEKKSYRSLLESQKINKVVYTVQQCIGCITDSFDNPNTARKRVGQLFENLIKLVIQRVGIVCEPRTITIPIPGYPSYEMSYELDLVFSRDKAVIASETKYIHDSEIVGSVKTTSKDRIDKVFLDKYLLTKLLGRDIPVIAIFLHDVQRATRGDSIFGINSTFKSNHFLGYTIALNKLDGVYYVDPRPEMIKNERLKEQIKDFQRFIVTELWELSER
jgi:hypothetical protein